MVLMTNIVRNVGGRMKEMWSKNINEWTRCPLCRKLIPSFCNGTGHATLWFCEKCGLLEVASDGLRDKTMTERILEEK